MPLTAEQQDALRDAGLLDPGTPLLSGGGVSGLPGGGLGGLSGGGVGGLPGGGLGGLSGGGVGGLGDLVPSSMFPTPIDGLDVSTLPDTGLGTTVGDLREPMVRTLPGAAGGGGLAGGALGTGGVTLPGTAGLDLPGMGTVGSGSGASAGTSQGGMPYMPMPMGGMGGAPGMGQGGSRDRQRNTWLTEDEEVWGTDPDCSPAVIGRDDTRPQGDESRRDGHETPASTPDRRVRRR
nr:hypothetical protein [Micromonospora sp. DSM 115978]